MFYAILFSQGIHFSKGYFPCWGLFSSNICLVQKFTNSRVKILNLSCVLIFGGSLKKSEKGRGVNVRPRIVEDNSLENQVQFGNNRKRIVSRTEPYATSVNKSIFISVNLNNTLFFVNSIIREIRTREFNKFINNGYTIFRDFPKNCCTILIQNFKTHLTIQLFHFLELRICYRKILWQVSKNPYQI